MSTPTITTQTVHSADGTVIAVDQLGSGDPVVLVQGGLCNRSANAVLARILSSQFTVFNYDRRGRGDSGDTAPFSVEREDDDLRAVIDLAGGSAAVFGSSSGAVLALGAAARGVPITQLALWEPSFVTDDSRPPVPAEYRTHIEDLLAQGRRGDVVEYFMTAGVGLPPEFVAPMRQAPFFPALEALATSVAYDAAQMGDFSLPETTLAQVRVHSLVLDGGTTPWISRSADAVATALELGTRKTLAGQTHDVDPTFLAPAVAAFLAAPQH